MSKLPSRRQFPAPPTQGRALVLAAHPHPDSFGTALADAWSKGAGEHGLEVHTIHLPALDFEPRLRHGFREEQPLEPDLVELQQQIALAEHLVLAFPIWWGSTPAVLKGVFDRVFLPGWAFAYENGRPVGGLAGRSARMLVTMDAPSWYDSLVYRGSARRQVGRATLGFCGYSPVRISAFGGIGDSKLGQRTKMLAAARAAGVKDGQRLVGKAPRLLLAG